MSSLRPDILVNPADLFIQTAPTSGTVPYMTQVPELGVRSVTGDGREFRFIQAGATALVPGTLLQSPAQIGSTHLQLTPTAAALGATQVTVTLGATAVVANEYAGGYIVVSADAGSGGVAGYQYKISSHPAAALSTAVVLTLEDALLNKITASAKIDLVLPQYGNGNITAGTYGAIIYPTTGTSAPIGVAINALAIGYYGWMQVRGTAAILNDNGGAITVGNDVVPSTSVAGAVKSLTGTLPRVGTAVTTITQNQVGTFKLAIS